MAITHMSFTASACNATARAEVTFDDDRATLSGTEFGTIQMSIEQSRLLYEALEGIHGKS